MTWISPSVGLLLGAIAIPIILLLYFLRLRRQPLVISSTMLWESAVEDLHANSPFQRLRPSVLLLLQLAALILVILAVMQPQIEGGIQKAGKHIILIDHSGSMETADENGATRLEEAKKQAIDLVEQLHGGGLFAGSGGETMVIAFSSQAVIISPFTDSEQQLTKAIDSIHPTHGRSSIDEALKLARAYTTNVNPEEEGLAASEFAKLELFSDGLISDMAEQALQRGEEIRFHQIGSSETTNVGISTIDAKRTSEVSDDVQVFLLLTNSGESAVTTDVEISIDGLPIGVQQVLIPPKQKEMVGSVSVVFVPFAMPQSGVIQATLSIEDALEIDNLASLVVPPPKELRVLISEEGPSLVRTVLEGMPLAELRTVNEQTLQTMLSSGETSAYDVVVTRGIEIQELPKGQYLIFGSPPPVEAFSTFVEGDSQIMLVAREEHPVMRFVRYEDIVVTKGYNIVTDGEVETLLEGSSWAAVLSTRIDGKQIVYVSFDPIDSNWPYLRSFPFFVFNAVQHLGRSGSVLTQSSRTVGQAISIDVPIGTESVQISEPDGSQHNVGVDGFGRANWGPIRLTGLHRVAWSDQFSQVVAVNSFPEESNVQSLNRVTIGSTKVNSDNKGGISFIQLWPWALGAVLFVLLAEWYVYQKKVGGLGRFTSSNVLGKSL